MKRSFSIKAVWDDEEQVFYSESDIIGLHIEAKTIEEFEAIFQDSAAELIVANHFDATDIASRSIKDLIPAIFWQRPEKPMATV